MRYLLLLVSLLSIVACSSAQESNTAAQEPVMVAEATIAPTPVPTWTPTPDPTNTPEPTPIPLSLIEVEIAIALPFQDASSKDGPVRVAHYESPLNTSVWVSLDPDLSQFGNAWVRLSLNDQDAAQKFKATFRTLSTSLLDTTTASEAITFVDNCYTNSIIPAVTQIQDTECVTTLNNGISLKVEYHYESNILLTWIDTTQ